MLAPEMRMFLFFMARSFVVSVIPRVGEGVDRTLTGH